MAAPLNLAPLPAGVTRWFRRAFDWVAVELIDARCADGNLLPVAFADQLIAHGVPDRRLAERTVQSHPHAYPTPPTLDDAAHVAGAMFDIVGGLCALRPGRLTRALVRIIDADAFACLDPRLQLPGEERYDWCVIPPPATIGPMSALADATIDTHVHLGGILPPSYFWIALCGGQLPLGALADLAPAGTRFAPPIRWIKAVSGAAADRFALAAALQRYSPRPVFAAAPAGDDPRWQVFLRHFETNDELPPNRRDILELSWELRRHARPQDPFVDPLRSSADDHYAAGERRLLIAVANRIRALRQSTHPQNQMNADRLEAALRRYLRVRNAFHQALVLDRGAGGLTRFLEVAHRRKALTGTPGQARRMRRLIMTYQRNRMSAAVTSQLVGAFPNDVAGGPRRELEIRTHVPPPRLAVRIMRAWLLGIADALYTPHGSRHRVALVFHVGKRAPPEKARTAAQQQLQVMRALLTDYPGLRRVVVGVDAAGDERSLAPRTLAAAMVETRRSITALRARPGRPPWQLGWTFHVGEDCWDLLTGLRHIDEVAGLILPSTGGRLGHAIALADHPERFYALRDGYTEPDLRAHLLDLVWAWGRLTRYAQQADHELLIRFLEDRLIRYTTTERIAWCWQAMQLAFPLDQRAEELPLDEAELIEILVPDPTARALLIGEALVEGQDREWQALMTTLQSIMKRRLGRSPITIEVNPTSNLVIGEFGDYHHLPYHVFVTAGLPVSINTDDPGLFLTTLSHEFAHLQAAGLRIPEATHAGVTRWLRDRLADATASRFIRDDTPDGTELVRDMQRAQPTLLLYDPA